MRGGLLLKPSYPPIHKTLIQGGLAIEEEKVWKEAKEKGEGAIDGEALGIGVEKKACASTSHCRGLTASRA